MRRTENSGPLMKKSLFFAVLAAALAAAVVVYAQRRIVPEVRFTLLSGETVDMSELRGRVVLVNFWASYCGTCLKEMPQLIETHAKFAPRGHDIIAVAVSRDDHARVVEFAKQLPFKVAFDGDGTVAREFGNVRVKPTTFIVDREGRILKRYIGEPDWRELHATLEKL
jgi:thiol-disulfide isomerase/thioredoxin